MKPLQEKTAQLPDQKVPLWRAGEDIFHTLQHTRSYNYVQSFITDLPKTTGYEHAVRMGTFTALFEGDPIVPKTAQWQKNTCSQSPLTSVFDCIVSAKKRTLDIPMMLYHNGYAELSFFAPRSLSLSSKTLLPAPFLKLVFGSISQDSPKEMPVLLPAYQSFVSHSETITHLSPYERDQIVSFSVLVFQLFNQAVVSNSRYDLCGVIDEPELMAIPFISSRSSVKQKLRRTA